MTPSPSLQIQQPSVSPRLQPSPAQSPILYQTQNQDGLLVVTSTANNINQFCGSTTTHDQQERVKTPNRRPSLTQSIQSSPNAGTAVIYRPSPTQSPAHLSTGVGVPTTTTVSVGHEFNTTLVGSNNISLSKVSLTKKWAKIFTAFSINVLFYEPFLFD